MQNIYLIKASKKFWFWFWNQLMNGFAPSDLHGNYKRPKGITIDSEYDINNENGQIYLLVGNSCPWCQRTLLVHEIKHLSKKVKVIFLKADVEHGEWIFNTNFKGIGQPLRIMLTGSKFGPGIYDIILSLGKNEVIKRLGNIG